MIHAPTGRSLFLAFFLLLAGCDSHRRAEPLVSVSGQVVSNGKPYKVKPEERLSVIFCMIDAENKPTDKSYLAKTDEKGHFTAEVLPGKYRIALRLNHGTRDNFHGAYESLNSPFVYDVHGGDSFTLDLKLSDKENKKSNKPNKKGRRL